MDFSTWEPIYEEILKDFGFDRAEDERSASILSGLLRDLDIKKAYEKIKLTIEGRRVIVCGKAHTLIEELGHIHQDFKRIPADMIEVGDWVRWKCMYGCKAYGKHLGCPPYVPLPEETRKRIKC